ncbi:hypothetical protein HQN59_22255 [Schlegelella sp. ID0723]|uniref:DUF5666 domain-containing protein n=2 Tax=Piscinibacter koreensis TaxID=2742824 RepID=A0A7Y6NSE5_9BURK|nr:hypothetical protein [Schlegelella koreensis]NUZ08476.1 hypothetical protein [Schlegelella koreensis]
MTKFLKLALAGVAVVSINVAMAHGPEAAKHGGTVAAAGDLGFELAQHGDVVHLYVDDHGTPHPTAGMTGKLTVLNGAEKSEADLTATEENKLEARGVKLEAGAKAVAAVTLPNKKVITVRFTVK